MAANIVPTVLAASDASDEASVLAALSVFKTVAAPDASVTLAVFLCWLPRLPLLPCLQLLQVLQALFRSHWLSLLYCVYYLHWLPSIEVVVQLRLSQALLNVPFRASALDAPSRIRPHRPHINRVSFHLWPPWRCAMERGDEMARERESAICTRGNKNERIRGGVRKNCGVGPARVCHVVL